METSTSNIRMVKFLIDSVLIMLFFFIFDFELDFLSALTMLCICNLARQTNFHSHFIFSLIKFFALHRKVLFTCDIYKFMIGVNSYMILNLAIAPPVDRWCSAGVVEVSSYVG